MTSHYVMVTNKLFLDDRNNEYIVLCKFGSHTISGYRVTGVGPPEPPPGPGKQKKPGLNRVNNEFILNSILIRPIRWHFISDSITVFLI